MPCDLVGVKDPLSQASKVLTRRPGHRVDVRCELTRCYCADSENEIVRSVRRVGGEGRRCVDLAGKARVPLG
jgi:hypothetical protein